MKVIISTILIFASQISVSFAQTNPFDVLLEPINISDLIGVQSFAYGQYNGKLLVVGGRLDGLHRRQPFAAFDEAGENGNLIVIDPVASQQWTAPLTSLSSNLQEQLSSTNMEFYQSDSILYCLGGYGYNNLAADHITYENLTAINVPLVINAIINGFTFNTFIRQITDSEFAVTGGRLDKIDNTYYLVGGQKFTGEYNPMGGPTFTQEYTNQIRKFTIDDNGTSISIIHLPSITDAVNLHRRDYNVMPQIMPNGDEGITAFSGVFQTTADVPYLNCVNIESSGYTVNNAFAQYYNHYHCANLPLYSASANEMHNVFFGGIAQYYDSAGILVQNNNVPFVKTIARVTRNASGLMSEYKMPVEMPSLLGAGSELIIVNELPMYNNGVLKLDEFTNDTTLAGYILGGISSSAANIFFTNTGTESSANEQLIKVYIIKKSSSGLHELNKQSINSLQMQVYPNPNDGIITIKFNLLKSEEIKLSISNSEGKVIKTETLTHLLSGENLLNYKIRKTNNQSIYFITIETKDEKAFQKIIIN